MDLPGGGRPDRGTVRRALSRGRCMEAAGRPGLEPATTDGAGPGTQRRTGPTLEEEGVARPKKKALREGRILVFIAESGLSQRPHRCRTWAPRGQTPVLQYNFNSKTLSVAAGAPTGR